MKRMYFAISILVILLCGSLGLNIWLYNISYRQYIKTESLRFDPYELNNYPESPDIFKKDRLKSLVVFFGDSRAAAWPEIADISYDFANRGINGQTTNQVLQRLPAHVATLSPKVVVIQVGVNDLKNIVIFPDRAQSIVANCKQNIQQIVEKLTQELQTTVVITTIFPAGELSLLRRLYWTTEIDRSIIEVNQFIKSLKSDRIIILDAATILADERGVTRSEYSQDHLHLNAIGYTKLNNELEQILKSLVR
ncbi:MAG: lysophospholipase [Pseudanabaena frigida]|uniref:Lysophospholipase n=1 Tax=Pseudanabaena frigida TaxID=945775 RepID=A0A2W4W4C7_9CYAN|nr:MAG: lysophospholipase [Pseudanabaena frigida]